MSKAGAARRLTPGLGGMLYRAARLRCPVCGGARPPASWFRMKAKCPQCGMRSERGEEDFFLGAMMFNIVLSEAVLAVLLVGLLVAMWPRVPWTFLRYGGVALMAVAPFFFIPFSRTVWLAFDLLLRPLTPEELAWHRQSAEGEFRPQSDR